MWKNQEIRENDDIFFIYVFFFCGVRALQKVAKAKQTSWKEGNIYLVKALDKQTV